MSRMSFSSIVGLTGAIIDNPMWIICRGSEDVLAKTRKKLTLHNKSVFYQLFKSKKRLQFWQNQLMGYLRITDNSFADKILEIQGKIEELSANIGDLTSRQTELLYVDKSDEAGNYLVIPAGLWYLPEKLIINTKTDKIPTFYLDGLRPYQKESLTELFSLEVSRATIVLGTGLGKTLLAINIAVAAQRNNKRTIIIEPTDHLIEQTVSEINKYTQNVTGKSSTRKYKFGCDIVVSTPQSAMGIISQFDVVIVDESHHLGAPTWLSLMSAAEKATHVYNLTATPFRTDGMDLAIHAFGGPVIYERDVKWGIDNGWLSKPDVYSIEIQPFKRDGTQITVSDNALSTTAYKKLVGHVSVLKYLKRQLLSANNRNKKIIILFKTLSVAEKFQKYCASELFFSVACDKYKGPLEKFKSGETNILVATDKLVSEGLNVPSVDVLFNVLQNSSEITTWQSIGRALRKTEGKSTACIVDIGVRGFRQFEDAIDKRRTIYSQIANYKVLK